MYPHFRQRRGTIVPTLVFLLIFYSIYYLLTIQQRLPSQEMDESHFKRSDSLSFVDTMKTFPWIVFKAALRRDDAKEIQRYSTLLLLQLISFLRKPPTIPINLSCAAPPLQMPTIETCEALDNPRKVGVLLQFGFDVDALEIHLHELDAVVDKFFLIESVQAHSSYLTHITKPLVWDMIKYDERFAKFSHKIVHFIVDDASLSQIAQGERWSRELQQEDLRWHKFLEWNNATNYFEDGDILGFGDVDEVPDRNNIFFLKNCQLPSDPIDIGIWFPFGNLNTIFASDFPVKGHNYTFGEPTFWTINKALRYDEAATKAPTRLQGYSLKYLLGGMHLSKYSFPPYQMTKWLTKSSAKVERTVDQVINVGMRYANNRSRAAENLLNFIPPYLSKRMRKLDEFRKENETEAESIVKIPWFLKCNRNRYPSFYGEHDSRLDA